MRRVLSALVLAVLFLALPAPAPAKGPTHMLLVAPITGASVAMETSDPRYVEVEKLLNTLGRRAAEPDWGRWHEVDVAWMMHGIDVFRSDIVFVDGSGAAVVMTVRSHLEGPGFSSDWRRVRDSEALTALFNEMGLMGKRATASSGKSGQQTSPAATLTATPPVTTAPVEQDSSSSWFSRDGWPWAFPGLLAGLLLGVLGAPLLRRRIPQVVAQRFARS